MRAVLRLLVSVLLILVGTEADAGLRGSPTVVELFTSQGCGACPSADRLLGELAARDDVIALSFHVDYWDYMGWKDRFASEQATRRQRAYARVLGVPMVYTPQMVVDGVIQEKGTNRAAVVTAIQEAARADRLDVDIDLMWTGHDRLSVVIPEGRFDGTATVWFVRYDIERTTRVTAGENAGRNLRHVNVVREVFPIATWSGEAVRINLSANELRLGEEDGSGCAIILQPEGLGPVLGA
ncbi:MAG: DUF1223 domain-containing protein, partial [Alphaproteobacteria bacterium]